jgi:hypothetical protein
LDSHPCQELCVGPETAADRSEHKANDADHGKDKTLPFGQALAFDRIARKTAASHRGEIDQHDPRRDCGFSAAAYFDAAHGSVNLLGLGYQGQGNAEPAPHFGQA